MCAARVPPAPPPRRPPAPCRRPTPPGPSLRAQSGRRRSPARRQTGGPASSPLSACRRERPDPLAGRRVVDQRCQPARSRLVFLRAYHPPDRRPSVGWRRRLEPRPRLLVGAERLLVLGRELRVLVLERIAVG